MMSLHKACLREAPRLGGCYRLLPNTLKNRTAATSSFSVSNVPIKATAVLAPVLQQSFYSNNKLNCSSAFAPQTNYGYYGLYTQRSFTSQTDSTKTSPIAHRKRRRKLPYRRLSAVEIAERMRKQENKLQTENSDSENSSINNTSSHGSLMPMFAVHIAQTIDLVKVMNHVFMNHKEEMIRSNNTKQFFGKNSVVLQLGNEQYVAVYGFGSLVCLNVPLKQVHAWSQDIKRLASKEPVLSGSERREQFGVLVVPRAPPMRPPYINDQEHFRNSIDNFASTVSSTNSGNNKSMHAAQLLLDDSINGGASDEEEVVVTGDYCIIPELDIHAVSVMSYIMAQTVALDSYNDTVDDLLAKFAALNTAVAKTGQFRATDKHFLFKTVATNNSIFIDMISKIRIKDRSDTAWNMTKYEKIHYGLKEEFEIDGRFEHIEFKLNLIQQNAKFFLEMLQSQKSNMLEWIIVILIMLECGLMCAEMTGLGEPFFKAIGDLAN